MQKKWKIFFLEKRFWLNILFFSEILFLFRLVFIVYRLCVCISGRSIALRVYILFALILIINEDNPAFFHSLNNSRMSGLIFDIVVERLSNIPSGGCN